MLNAAGSGRMLCTCTDTIRLAPRKSVASARCSAARWRVKRGGLVLCGAQGDARTLALERRAEPGRDADQQRRVIEPAGAKQERCAQVDEPLETRAFVSARFATGAAKYRWLSNTQCVGYGRIQIASGEASRATFDIYAMQ